VEVWEAGDGILVRVADEVPPARLQDTADIGQGSLLAEKVTPRKNQQDSKGEKENFQASWLKGKIGALRVGGPGRRRGGREPGEAAVVEHPVDGEGDGRTEHGPAELRPHRGGAVRVERAPERRVERGGVAPRRRRREVVGGDRAQGLVQLGGHAVPLLQLQLLLTMFSKKMRCKAEFLCGIVVGEEEDRIVGPVYQPGEQPHSDRLTIETEGKLR